MTNWSTRDSISGRAARRGDRREQRRPANGVTVLSTAGHPGYSRTNLQTSGPGQPENVLQKLVERVASHDAAEDRMASVRYARRGLLALQ